jgi:hypothetical protein
MAICRPPRALVQGLAARQRVERDLGAHDNRRVSLFEQVEYSILFDDRLAIWVLKGTGELLGSKTVSTRVVGVRTVCETITAALKTMGVRGRDAIMRQAERQSAEDAVQEDAWTRGCRSLLSTLCACWAWGASEATGASLGRQGTEVEADTAQGRLDAIKRDQEVLGAFYQLLLAPVEAHLAGATEVLLAPHTELFDVPWAALFDCKTGQYVIQRSVLRVAPSLRVARTAADMSAAVRATRRTYRWIRKGAEEKGHALV